LFHRAAAFSGSVFGASATPPRAEVEQAGLAVQAALGVKSVAERRLLPDDKIVAVLEGAIADHTAVIGLPGAPAP
jgi:hypothetical protein